jgi:hypothetical protein
MHMRNDVLNLNGGEGETRSLRRNRRLIHTTIKNYIFSVYKLYHLEWELQLSSSVNLNYNAKKNTLFSRVQTNVR